MIRYFTSLGYQCFSQWISLVASSTLCICFFFITCMWLRPWWDPLRTECTLTPGTRLDNYKQNNHPPANKRKGICPSQAITHSNHKQTIIQKGNHQPVTDRLVALLPHWYSTTVYFLPLTLIYISFAVGTAFFKKPTMERTALPFLLS